MKRLKLLEVSRSKIGGGNPFELLARCSQLEELYFVKNSIQKMKSNDQNVANLIQQIASSPVLRSFECLIDSTKHQSLTAKSVFSKLEKLKVEAMNGMKAFCIGPPPSGLLTNLKELFLKHCSQLASLAKLELLNLELIELEDCPKLTSLFTFAIAQKMKMLRVLKVRDCSKLKHILTGEKKEYVFPELKHVTVKECNNLECIIPSSSAGGLSKLESLEVENAAALTHVFGKSNYGSDQNQRQHIIKLPDLKVFKLIGLQNIIGYCPPNYDIQWPTSLDKPYIMRCPLLSSLSEASGGVEATRQDIKMNVGHGIAKKKLERLATQKDQFNAFVDEKDILEAKVQEVKAKKVERSADLEQLLKKAKTVLEKVKRLEGEGEPSKSYCGISSNWTDHKDKSSSVLETQDFIFFESTKKASCSKTSLVMEVCKVVKGLKLFDDVIYVRVPGDPNVKRIRAKIADWLGLLLIEETEVGKAQRLRERLKMGDKFLFFLDDMWSVLDLGEIGIPLAENCKVILTTRLRRTISLMGCQKEVCLPLLTQEEAWDLFHNHVGVIEKGLEVGAQKIVEECQGLPGAILAIARALKGKEAAIWDEASEEPRDYLAVGSGSGQETLSKLAIMC
ncbi:hypothetical protein K1719_034290 [Acacia pycnantha]|nr:hypothetical protein K1719_034290 [Acacia pycnantha]